MIARVLIALLCLAGTLGLTASATAYGVGQVTAERNLTASLPIARAAWAGSRCAGRELVVITSALGGDRDAEAEVDGSCIVRIRPIRNAYKFCVTLVHEFGHLTETVDEQGHLQMPDGRPVDEGGHTHDGSIMDIGNGFWEPCEALGPRVTPSQAAADTFDIPSSQCRLTGMTARPRGHLYRCGRTRRVLVVLTTHGDVDYVTDPPQVKRSR